MKHPERIVLWVAMREARARGDWQLVSELQQKLLVEKFGGRLDTQERLDALEARLERLDARRVKQAPGQGALDLGGQGQACGKGWISPDYTCHQGGGAAPAAKPAPQKPAVLDASKPFSPAVMEQLKAGIEQRAFPTQSARHDGTDLALALEKLANAEGEAGENARAAMAFMDEVKAIVKIGPTRESLPSRGEEMLPPSLDLDKELEPQLQALQAYLQDGRDTATRLRNYGQRFGFFTPERLAALQADKSPVGEQDANTLDRAMNPRGDGPRFQKLVAELDAAVAAHRADPEDERLRLQLRSAFAIVTNSSWTSGPHADSMAAGEALQDASGVNGTGGHYTPASNSYQVVSRAGEESGALRPNDVGPSGMAAAIGNSIRTRNMGATPIYSLGRSHGLTNSERVMVTHLHELGHMVHDASQRRIVEDDSGEGASISFAYKATRRLPANAKKVLTAQGGPSRYANTNAAELFAESFVAYVVAPDTLKQEIPELHQWVRLNMIKARNAAQAGRDAISWGLH
jgi:hypothetical protein